MLRFSLLVAERAGAWDCGMMLVLSARSPAKRVRMVCVAAQPAGTKDSKSKTRKLTAISPFLRLCLPRNPHRRRPRLHPRLGPPIRSPLPTHVPPLFALQIRPVTLDVQIARPPAVVCPRASHQRPRRRSARRKRQRSVCTCVVRASRPQRHCCECQGNVHGVCDTRSICGVRVRGDIDRGRQGTGER